MAVFYVPLNQQMEKLSVNWQREIATQAVFPIYQQMDKLVCCLLVGSAARNLQGQYSDVDLVMYWHTIPSDTQRTQLIETAAGIIHEMGDSSDGESDLSLQSQSDVFYLLGDQYTGVKIDVTHKAITSAKKLIDDVVVRHDTQRLKLAILHSLQRGIPLYGDPWINARLAQIGTHMPKTLAIKLIKGNYRFNPIWVFDMFTDRPDPVLYHRFRSKNIDQVLMVLSAVNRLYMPDGFKHLEAFIDELNIQPNNLTQDLYQMLDSDPATAKPLMLRLGDAVHELVAQHIPDIDIREAREYFHYTRPKHVRSPLVKET